MSARGAVGAGAARAQRRAGAVRAAGPRLLHVDRHPGEPRGASITGDEPFYLITTQSLLRDGDLDLRNQYATRSHESFFDHADGLWTQSVPLADGLLLSPHNVGLSLLALPGFAIDGLVGVQVQLVLIAALTWALAYVLALRLSGARPWLVWLATLAVALSATAFIYSSEVYPEIPAGLALVGALLVATGRERLSPSQVLAPRGTPSPQAMNGTRRSGSVRCPCPPMPRPCPWSEVTITVAPSR